MGVGRGEGTFQVLADRNIARFGLVEGKRAGYMPWEEAEGSQHDGAFSQGQPPLQQNGGGPRYNGMVAGPARAPLQRNGGEPRYNGMVAAGLRWREALWAAPYGRPVGPSVGRTTRSVTVLRTPRGARRGAPDPNSHNQRERRGGVQVKLRKST